MILEITGENFEKEILNADKKAIVDFWAPWCNPCKMMHPVIEELDNEVGDRVKIGKVNIDENPQLASKFGVMSIPTFVVFENNRIVNSKVGVQSLETLKEMLGV